jgi:hypothetical protein
MSKIIKLVGGATAAIVLMMALVGCQTAPRARGPGAGEPPATERTVQPPNPGPQHLPETQATTTAASGPAKVEPKAQTQPEGKSHEDKQAEEAKKTRERERKLAKLERSLEVARLNLSKANLALEHGETQFEDSLVKTEAELEMSKTRLADFTEFASPNRVARAELGLQQAEDGFTEAQEELYQLELMYRDEQFADQTKEIVIERAKRRLERAQRDLEIRREELKALVDRTLPLEQRELELAVRQHERDLEQAQRSHQTTVIEQKVAILNAEAELDRLEIELSDLREEIQEAEQKHD